MAKFFKPVTQPPIELHRRPSEARPAWLGVVLALAGGALIVAALFRAFNVAGAANNTLTEPQVVEQVTHGGIVFTGTDTAAAAQETRRALALKGGQKSADPCPT